MTTLMEPFRVPEIICEMPDSSRPGIRCLIGRHTDCRPVHSAGRRPTWCNRDLVPSVCRRIRQVLPCRTIFVLSGYRRSLGSRNRDKSFAHACLSASRNPVARVGEGAQHGARDLKSQTFDDLVDFLTALFGHRDVMQSWIPFRPLLVLVQIKLAGGGVVKGTATMWYAPTTSGRCSRHVSGDTRHRGRDDRVVLYRAKRSRR